MPRIRARRSSAADADRRTDGSTLAVAAGTGLEVGSDWFGSLLELPTRNAAALDPDAQVPAGGIPELADFADTSEPLLSLSVACDPGLRLAVRTCRRH